MPASDYPFILKINKEIEEKRAQYKKELDDNKERLERLRLALVHQVIDIKVYKYMALNNYDLSESQIFDLHKAFEKKGQYQRRVPD